MFLSIHPASGVPIYRQIFQQLRERIVSGQLKVGEQLPSVRDLSAELKVNSLTVAKVYQFLEREGLVETRRGQGTFVAAGVKQASAASRRQQLEPSLRQLVAEAMHLDLDEHEVGELLSKTFKNMKRTLHERIHHRNGRPAPELRTRAGAQRSESAGETGKYLRISRPQRGGQDDDDEDPGRIAGS